MKKFLLLILALFTMTASAFAADSEPRFDNMRTALIVSTTQRGAEAQYMLKRLREPFRIPYWDRVEAQEQLAPDGITIDAMRALSEKYNADIVVVPVVQTWYWRQYQFFFRFDGEIVTDCAYYLSVYAYDRKQDTLKSYSSRGRERESASILNNPYEILGKAMDEVLAKLPYKRIPTDIEAVRGSISKLDVKTTEGGAKIITNELPIPVTQ
ncbi:MULTISPECIES: hypothetical protein [Megasphaera]|jgi:hypothetical protein|uniref:hypothetical protein n=1 Tax=Megasphaera TaxID=906 RepID=UPI000B3BB3A8|nr:MULTISPECIES: hypothetical protein [Megasphaera]MBM6733319.1 hypothetical protein [Megasphaera stantonii]OUO47130.1 hypothetical protein B5F80_04385 [Megasphaera sp. An286]